VGEGHLGVDKLLLGGSVGVHVRDQQVVEEVHAVLALGLDDVGGELTDLVQTHIILLLALLSARPIGAQRGLLFEELGGSVIYFNNDV
jgi:hypothetical protein